MKWKLIKKDKDISVSVSYSEEDSECDFNYVDMVKRLYRGEKIENIEYEGDYSDAEKESIEELRCRINSCFEDKQKDE